MSSFDSAADVTDESGLASRLAKVMVYTMLAGLIAWRAWTYDTPLGEPYPMMPMFLCAGLVAILYTLSILTLAGRSAVLAGAVVAGERGDSTPQQAAGRARA